MRRISTVLGVGLLTLALVSFASPASAIDDISIPIDNERGIRGEPGSVTTLATTPVEDELVGATCQAELVEVNNESVHPDNDLIITSGTWSDTVEDFESDALSVNTIQGGITLGETVVVQLRFGPSGVSSAGFELSFDCSNPVFPTTSTVPVPTTTEAPTVVLPETQVPASPAPTPLPETRVEAATAAQPTFTG
jgi:hypothetical protein